MHTAVAKQGDFAGSDRLLFGLVLGVLTFWLFAQSTLNIAPAMAADLGVAAGLMNIAVAAAALFSGIFTVVFGGLADRVGRLRMVRIGFQLAIAGSLLIALAPAGTPGAAMLLSGRALQGLSAACILPASLALVKTCWGGADRQRAISLWSMGAWGGAGIFKMASALGAALGLAVSATVFTALAGGGGGVQWLEGVVTFHGEQRNLAIRQAAMVALMANVLLVALATAAIALAIPRGRPAD